MLSQKLANYKKSLKSKEQRLREAFTEGEENRKRIKTLEEQVDKLLNAFKKQRSNEEKLLNDHLSNY